MHKELKKIFDNYLYILLFLSIWLSIDTNFDNILTLKKDINIRTIFLSLRTSLPYFIFITLLANFYLNKNKINILTNNKSFNITLMIFFFYFLSQIPGLITTKNNFLNSYYVLMALIAIFCASISFNTNKNLEKTYYIICIIFLIPLVCTYGYLSWEWILRTQNLNMYGTFPHVFTNLEFFSTNVIRSSGLARSTMIIIVPLFFLLLVGHTKYFSIFVYLILSSIIYLTQSRIVVTFFIFFSFFSIIYFDWDTNLWNKIKKTLLLVLLPILFFNSVILFKEELRTGFIRKILNEKFDLNLPITFEETLGKSFVTKFYLKYNEKFNLEERVYGGRTTLGHKGGLIRTIDPNTFTSNRYGYWKKIINKSEQPFLGYGPLGDRFLIDVNCGNTLIYSYVSGGIVATILMLLLMIRYTYVYCYILFYKKTPLTKENIILISSIFTIAFLFTRGIAEVGVGVFSIDFIVFLSCAMVCERFMIKNQTQT